MAILNDIDEIKETLANPDAWTMASYHKKLVDKQTINAPKPKVTLEMASAGKLGATDQVGRLFVRDT